MSAKQPIELIRCGSDDDEEMTEATRLLLRQARSGENLGRKLAKASEHLLQIPDVSKYFTSIAFQASLTGSFSYWLFAMAILLLACDANFVQLLRNDSLGTFNRFEFIVKETRGGSDPASLVSLAGLGVLRDGFKVEDDLLHPVKLKSMTWQPSGRVTLEYDRSTPVNGFWMKTSESADPGLDPTSFEMYGTNFPPESTENQSTAVQMIVGHKEAKWHQIGASSATYDAAGWAWRFRSEGASIGMERGATVVFDYRLPKVLCALRISSLACLAINFAAAGLLAIQNRTESAVFVCRYVMVPIHFLISTWALAECQNSLNLTETLATTVISAFCAIAIICPGRYFVFVWSWTGIGGLVWCVGFGFLSGSFNIPAIIFCFSACLGCLWIRWRRWKLILQTRRLTDADRVRYESVFRTVLAAEEQELQSLEELIRSLGHEAVGHSVRLCQVIPAAVPADGGDTGQKGSNPRLFRAVESLDCLFSQAAVIHPFLLEKVQGWAKGCGGLVPRVAKVKSEARACEKIVRAYECKTSAIVDLCRQTVIFDKVADLVNFVRMVSEDTEVEILRTKNRLDRGYDSTISAGYRDLQINIRIFNEHTKRLGVEWHICEVLGLLTPCAELKSESGHRAYVQLRNLLGE